MGGLPTMGELHAAITAHLRVQRRQSAETGARESAILNIWQDRCAVPCCKACGAPVNDDKGQLYNLADMLTVRQCRNHYVPF